MPKFAYVALDARGQEYTGALDADSKEGVVNQLRQAGYFPTSVEEAGKAQKAVKKAGKSPAAAATKKGASLVGKRSVSAKILMIFTRQLATLIDAGLPLMRGLAVLAKQEKNPVLRATIDRLADSVQSGATFSESLAQHPKIFNKLYINMVKAGELGGVLEIVLLRLAEFQEKAQKVKNKVVAAMFYPIIVLVIAVSILAFLLTFIVPKFQDIFRDMLGNKPLPALTQFVIEFSNIVKGNLLWIVLAVAAVAIAYNMIARTPNGRAMIDRVKLRMPLFGDLIRKSSISRFSRTLGTLVTSGVPILQALNITRETAGNVVVANAISKIHDSVKEGEPMVQPMESSGVFPPMVVSMVDVGEETGQLPEMLLKIAEVYDDEVDNAVAGITSLLEPIMIVFLAVIVGTIVIALFLPLISIIGNMNQQ